MNFWKRIFRLTSGSSQTAQSPTESFVVDDSSSEDLAYDLIRASENGELDRVKNIVSRGVDVSYVDRLGRTALYAASEKGHDQIVEELINAGANVNQGNLGVSEGTALIEAAGAGHVAVVERLLLAGAEIDAETDVGRTALMLACNGGHGYIVEVLLNNDANINLETPDGLTALKMATSTGHSEIGKLLLGHGAEGSYLKSDERYAKELLAIDRTDGLICSVGEGITLSEPFDKDGRHTRGREIGRNLWEDDSTGARMISVAESFYALGGRKRYLDFCWHEIGDWLA